MNVALPTLNGRIIMGTDLVASAGHQIRVGNNTTIVLKTDTRDQADEFHNAPRTVAAELGHSRHALGRLLGFVSTASVSAG